jgi:tetratricopeptide (TPR) repeat protein
VGLVVLAAATAGLGWYASGPAREREKALRLSRQGAFAEAKPLLKRALERNAGDLDVVKALALGYFDAHQDEQADDYLERWHKLQPDADEPRERLMQVLVRQVKVKMALANSETVPEPEAEALEPQRQQVLSSLVEGRHAEAEQLCRRYLERRPGSPTLRYLLAEACHLGGKDEEAASVLDQVLRGRPLYRDALLLRAVLYGEADQAEQAIPLLRRVLSQDRFNTRARYHLGQALARTGRTAEAEQQMAEMLRHDAVGHALHGAAVQPRNLEGHVKAAEALLNSGRSEEGIRLLRQVLARHPGYAPARRALSASEGTKGHPPAETSPRP